MKTKLTISCLLLSTMLMAQVNNLPTVFNLNNDYYGESVFGVVPSSLSYDGSNRVYVRTDDNQVAIYSNAFTPVKSFNITPTMHGYEVIEMERIVTVTVIGGEQIGSGNVICSYDDNGLQVISIGSTYNDQTGAITYDYNVPSTWGETDVKNFLESPQNMVPGASAVNGVITIISTIPASQGGIFFLYDIEPLTPDGRETGWFWEYETYGTRYPILMYLWKNGYLYFASVSYSVDNEDSDRQVSFSYSDWTETSRTPHEYAQRTGLPFINYDTDQVVDILESGDGLCLTQTLFNEDEKYEYLSFPISGYSEVTNDYPDEPVCSDCYYESTTFIQNRNYYSISLYNGFDVKSEDGNTLQSISFPNGFQMKDAVTAQIIKLENEFYLICTGEMNDNAAMLVYKINRTGTGSNIQQVSAPMHIAAFPSPANRNQTITINLGGDNKTATEVQVINMNGQVLDRRTIPAGQQQTTLPASRLAPGTNLINATQNGQPIGTTRVIVM